MYDICVILDPVFDWAVTVAQQSYCVCRASRWAGSCPGPHTGQEPLPTALLRATLCLCRGDHACPSTGPEDTSVMPRAQPACSSRSRDGSGWKDHCGSSGPASLLKQAHPRASGTGYYPNKWDISRQGDATASLGHCTVKDFFLMLRQNFLCISFCPLPRPLWVNTEQSLVHPLGTPNPPLDIQAH